MRLLWFLLRSKVFLFAVGCAAAASAFIYAKLEALRIAEGSVLEHPIGHLEVYGGSVAAFILVKSLMMLSYRRAAAWYTDGINKLFNDRR